MYAIVQTGGKQVKVSEGDIVRVEKLAGEVGDLVELGPVSLVAKDDGIVVDPAALGKARVSGTILRQDRAKKIRVFKMKRRKNYSRTYGHRQAYTEIKIEDIEA